MSAIATMNQEGISASKIVIDFVQWDLLPVLMQYDGSNPIGTFHAKSTQKTDDPLRFPRNL